MGSPDYGRRAMGKASKKKSDKDSAPPDPSVKSLGEAMVSFGKGDYITARMQLEDKAKDASLSDGARKEAEERIAATRLDKTTVLVGLACAALFGLVVLVTTVMMPHGG